MKKTAIAPSNIAFIKYWGKKDEELRLPLNSSLSMNLSAMQTTTTVAFSPDYKKDGIFLKENNSEKAVNRVTAHLDRIRKMAGLTLRARVVSENNFPSSTGLSSSASAFAALTLAGAKAAGLKLPEKEISILARLGSGSACRSIPDGFAEWLEGSGNNSSFAYSVFPPDYFEIADIVAVISSTKKDISSTKGQTFINTSPFLKTRLLNINNKIKEIKKYIKERNFSGFGQITESEALEMHAVMITSNPSLIYWQPETVKLMKYIIKLRNAGLEGYFTLNTGQDVHIIVRKSDAMLFKKELEKLSEVKNVIINYPGIGARLTDGHLF